MLERILTTIAVIATVCVISIPAQQAVTGNAGRFANAGGRVLVEPIPSVFTAVEGSVLKADSTRFSGALVRLREARIGRIVLTQQADDNGLFQFRPIDRGSYVVELLADEKTVLAASPLVYVNAGEVAQTVVREPLLVDPTTMAGFADAHAAAVQAAAATAGILARKPGDDVSPR